MRKYELHLGRANKQSALDVALSQVRGSGGSGECPVSAPGGQGGLSFMDIRDIRDVHGGG